MTGMRLDLGGVESHDPIDPGEKNHSPLHRINILISMERP